MTHKPRGGPLARLAGQLCSNPAFQQYLGAESADDAAQRLRATCHIQSRAELDHDQGAARLFHERVRRPFVEGRRST